MQMLYFVAKKQTNVILTLRGKKFRKILCFTFIYFFALKEISSNSIKGQYTSKLCNTTSLSSFICYLVLYYYTILTKKKYKLIRNCIFF